MRNYKTKNYVPAVVRQGDWVVVLTTQEKGYVEKIYDDGDRILVRVPSNTDWPFPRWLHVDGEKVRKSSAPKPPKEETPSPDTDGEALL